MSLNYRFIFKKTFTSIIRHPSNVLSILFMALFIASLSTASLFAQKKVIVGYQPVVNPWKAAIVAKTFEKETGYDIEWRRFDSGASVINAMASGDLNIGMSGSTGIAAGMSRGVEIELFWVLEDLAAAEAFAVRDGTGIINPQDLKGKRIGVPFVSTTHLHLLFALEQFSIPENSVRILNLQPSAIASAWASGSIDAAFVWYPVLGEILKDGKILVTSGQLSSWGKATFDGLVVGKRWAARNKAFMRTFTRIIAETDAAYNENPAAWTSQRKNLEAISKLSGAKVADIPDILAKFNFLSAEQQASAQWLGGGSKGGAAETLRLTSQFLKDNKKLPSLQSDYGQFVNPEFAQAAAR